MVGRCPYTGRPYVSTQCSRSSSRTLSRRHQPCGPCTCERDADLRRQAVATRLQFVVPEGQAPLELQARSETHALRGEGERLIDAPATLRLPGGGQLVITPGGDDLVALARAHGDARDALGAALRAHGVADIAEARSRSADLDAQIKLAQHHRACGARTPSAASGRTGPVDRGDRKSVV